MIHRLLICCFLFAFIGQLSLPLCLDKKIVLEWSDADDDSSDSEDFEEELAIEASVLNLIYEFSVIYEDIHGSRCWHNSNVTYKEILFSIDYPPEIS
jgi:hypothetical protein